jgi:hypothetical protein
VEDRAPRLRLQKILALQSRKPNRRTFRKPANHIGPLTRGPVGWPQWSRGTLADAVVSDTAMRDSKR